MSLQRLEVTPFPVVIRDIITDKSSGQLVIARGGVRRVVYWAHGEPVLVIPSSPSESLWAYLVHEKVLDPARAQQLQSIDPQDVVPQFQSLGAVDGVKRNMLLRNWLLALVVPLFSLEDGTALFTDEEALDPERRVFLQSVAPLVISGTRTISNGLIIRNALGDLKQKIAIDEKSPFPVETLPLNESEHKIATSLREPVAIEEFLKNFQNESAVAAKVVIMLMTLGVFAPAKAESTFRPLEDDPQRDIAILAAIGANNPVALKAVGLARQLPKLDYYALLDLPRATPTARIVERAEQMKKIYDPNAFPPAARQAVTEISRALDSAIAVLSNPVRRQQYDRMLTRGVAEGRSIEQVAARRQIAFSNFEKAKELTIMGDYYGAIVLLKQTVTFDPTLAEAWHLLGSCQERNPKWRRDAAVSFQKALAADPNFVDAMISLGDLYKSQGLTSRAQNFYEDVLAIEPDHIVAKNRLKELKK